jgi:hypothetical protein
MVNTVPVSELPLAPKYSPREPTDQWSVMSYLPPTLTPYCFDTAVPVIGPRRENW